MDENYTEPDLSKIVKQLMDEEGYEFGEAVKKAMEMGYKDGGLMVAIQKFNQGGRAYDSRASLEDMAKAIQTSSAANDNQKLRMLMDYNMSMNPSVTPQNVSSSQGKMENLLGLQTNPNFNYMKPSGPALLMPPMVSTGFRQDRGYFGNEGIMINGKRYMSEDDAIDDMGVETYNRFMADGGMAGGKTYHQFHDQYVPMDEESMGYAYGGGVGSMMQPRQNYLIGGEVVEDTDFSNMGLQNIINSDLPQNTQVAGGYNSPNEGAYGFNLIELDRLKDAGYDPAEVSGYENKEDVQNLIRSLEPTARLSYDKLNNPTMTDASTSLFTQRAQKQPSNIRTSPMSIEETIQANIDKIQSTPGFEGYTPSTSVVDQLGITDRNRGMNNIGPATEIDTFSENFDKNYDASSDLQVPGMGKKAIDFIDAPVDFMMRANNPRVFDPVVNTKNFVQDGITTLKSNLTPRNIATSVAGSKIASAFGIPGIIGSFLARSLFGKKEDEFEGPYDDINNDGVIDRFDKARTTFGQSKNLKEYFEKVKAIKAQKEIKAQEAAERNRAETAAIQARVDRQYEADKARDGRDFSVSGPDTSANPTGKSNQASSERGYGLHGAKGGIVPNGLSRKITR